MPNTYWNASTDPQAKQLASKIIVNMEREPERHRQPAAAGDARLDRHGLGVQAAAKDKILTSPSLKADVGQPGQRLPLVRLHQHQGHPERALPGGHRVRGEQDHAAGRLRRPDHRRPDRQHGHAADRPRLPELRPVRRDHQAERRRRRGQAAAAAVRQAERLHHRHRLPDRQAQEVAAATALQAALARSASRPRCAASRRRSTTATSPACPPTCTRTTSASRSAAGAPTGRTATASSTTSPTATRSAPAGTRTSPRSTTRWSTTCSTKAASTTNDQRSATPHRQIDMQIMKDAAILPIVYQKVLLYRNPNVTNVYMDDTTACTTTPCSG